ncbi:MAG: methyltransferase domain-containing protein [Nanoarchaeota archaeon]|nr:methyltransferase domain-containing protein [Nanoarchaeota archaeon]
MKCRVCQADCKMFLDLGKQPIANNFLTPEHFKDEWFYNLQVYFCPDCFTVQIGECPDSSQVFNENYSFFTGTSAHMVKHFANLADLIKEKYLPENGCIMEIGSNDGTFLQHFKDNVHLGFDPSESVNSVARSKGVHVYPFPFQNFGDVAARWPKTDVFASSNAFAHIPDRNGVLSTIKEMLAPDGIWIDEQPYLGNIIDQLAYDQFYNEHAFYTSLASMRNVLDMFDLEIIDFEFWWTHGGSIRYFVKHKEQRSINKIEEAIKAEGFDTFDIFDRFGKLAQFKAKQFKQRLTDMKRPVVGYAATAKSTTILNYCNIGPDIVSKIYDTTPAKQGKYSPGMHIPIEPYAKFNDDNPEDVILFAHNHAAEIFKKEHGKKINWILPHQSETNQKCQLFKICAKCNVYKDAKEFSKDKSKKDGLQKKCKECDKQYYQDNKEKIIARIKDYYQNNKPQIVAQMKQYNKDHKFEKGIYDKDYRLTDAGKESHRKGSKRYSQTDSGKEVSRNGCRRYGQTENGKESYRKASSKRRALKANAIMENFSLKEVFKRDGYRCQLCSKKTRPDYNHFHPLYPNLDHIIPLSKGGPHTKANTQCLCHSCNMIKHNTGNGDQLRMF